MKPKRLTTLLLAVVLALVAAACGDDDEAAVPQSGERPESDGEETSDASDDLFPVTVAADNGEVTIEARPEAIVSLSPTGTEMLFAIGAGDQVLAVDERSYFPSEAPVTDLSGFQPNVEAIAGYEPDLVVLAYDPGDVAAALGQIDIPVIWLDAAEDLDGTYAQIEVLGAATGRISEAAELVAQMQADIANVVADLDDDTVGGTYFHELDESLYTITSDTFAGHVYGLLGLVSIADGAEGAADAAGYPQLSAEFVLEADPDFIFLADAQCCDQSPETVASRPGWDQLSAVAGDRVIVVDEDMASRWGPRVVDHLRMVAEAISAHETVR